CSGSSSSEPPTARSAQCRAASVGPAGAARHAGSASSRAAFFPAALRAMLHGNGGGSVMIRAVSCILAGLFMAGATGAAGADEMAFYVKNMNDHAIAFELHGGGGRVWPGGNQVWMIEEKMRKSI